MKVMLSGVGGDEVFAGYPRHLAWKISRVIDRLPATPVRAAGRLLLPLSRPGLPGRLRGPRRNLWKYQRATGLSPLERYLSFSSYYDRAELTDVLAAPLRESLDGYEPLTRHRGYLYDDVGGDELSRLLYLDSKTFLPCLNLTYTDKLSMAASVEVRVPLLDDALVDLARRIPSELKLRGWRRKYILKKSQETRLPRDVIWRRKAGFGAPVRSWLQKDLKPLVDDLLSPQAIKHRGLLDSREVDRIISATASGSADFTMRIYALLTLELWCQTFMDRSWSWDTLGDVDSPAVQVA
jgi:asparagine synthase (glutamine-hydrolysing)